MPARHVLTFERRIMLSSVNLTLVGVLITVTTYLNPSRWHVVAIPFGTSGPVPQKRATGTNQHSNLDVPRHVWVCLIHRHHRQVPICDVLRSEGPNSSGRLGFGVGWNSDDLEMDENLFQETYGEVKCRPDERFHTTCC
jgi:hypothetical protein